MISKVIDKIEREIELRKNMPHNYEKIDICYGLNQAKEIAKKVLKESRPAYEKIADYRSICAAIFADCDTEEELNETYNMLRDNMVCEMATRAEALGIDPDTL